MLRWGLLAVVVVLISGAATLALPYMSGEQGLDAAIPSVPEGPPPGPQGAASVVGEDKARFFSVHDFGIMSQHETGHHAWEVKNVGEGDLEVWFASSTCSCTIAKLGVGDKATLKPGESTEIKLEWETRGNEGPYEKSATIGTSDYKRPRLEFRTKGIVLPVLASAPFPPVFTDLETDVSKGLTVSMPFFSASKTDMKIIDVKSSKPELITATNRPMTDEERKERKLTEGGLIVDFEIKPGMPVGPFSDEVILVTDHPKAPEFSVKLIGTVLGPIRFFPSRIFKSGINGAVGAQAQVKISVQGTEPVEFSVKRHPKGMRVTVQPDSGNAETVNADNPMTHYILTAEAPPGTPVNTYTGSIELTTNHPHVKTLVVPASLVVTK